MKSVFSAAVLALLGHSASASCQNGTFQDISAAEFLARANPTWNLGNTLDAIPDEGSWNNPPVEASTFDDVVAAGFKGVRIPVTYTHHFLSEAPDYEVDPVWLQRVSDVIDFALERGLYVVTNVHHDSWEWADVRTGDIDVIQAKFRALWVQIGNKLADKPSSVAFENINEPPADTEAQAVLVNQFNDIFLEALAETGDHNTRRVVTLCNGANDPQKTSQWFQPPPADTTTNPWAIQIHYYSPYDFTFSAWGKTIWGSDADKAAIDYDLGVVRGNFTDVPIYIGEFDSTPRSTESAARWKWFDYFSRAAVAVDATLAIWDNGLDHLDREAGELRDPTVGQLIVGAIEGVDSSLPDSTVDGAATEQWSSAYIYHKVGDEIADQELPYLFNGNTLTSITTSEGTELAAGTDYIVGDASITFTADFIQSYIDASSPAAVYDVLTLTFSTGASPTITIVQWDVPTLAATSGTGVAGSDHTVAVEWAGLDKLAAVKLQAEDGTYLFDDWTQYLGPLQQARGVSASLVSLVIFQRTNDIVINRPGKDSGVSPKTVSSSALRSSTVSSSLLSLRRLHLSSSLVWLETLWSILFLLRKKRKLCESVNVELQWQDIVRLLGSFCRVNKLSFYVYSISFICNSFIVDRKSWRCSTKARLTCHDRRSVT